MADKVQQLPKQNPTVQPQPQPSVMTTPKAVAPPTLPSGNGPSLFSEQERYLDENGWKFLWRNAWGVAYWSDPIQHGLKAERKRVGLLPAKGGGTEILEQMVGPPAQFDYLTDLACEVQRSRDNAGVTIEDVIKEKEKEIAQLRAKIKPQPLGD